ncbi:hypothetical protein BH09MYX1_BH09MYX1_34040 [soil metagenome]
MTAPTLDRAALAEMPIFPLPRIVFFPGTLLPLHVFESRYRTMLAESLRTHRAMIIVRTRADGAKNAAGAPAIESIAGAGVIVEHELLADGRSNLVLVGVARVKLDELPFVEPYRRARSTVLSPVPTHVPDGERAALVAAATSFVNEIRRRDASFDFPFPDGADAATVADACAAHLVVDADSRQAALEELDEAKRVRLVTRELMVQDAAFRGNDKRVLH